MIVMSTFYVWNSGNINIDDLLMGYSHSGGHSYLKLNSTEDREDMKAKMRKRYFETGDEDGKKSTKNNNLNAKEVRFDFRPLISYLLN